MAFRFGAKLEELKTQTKMLVEVEEHPIMLLYYKDKVYAVDNRCPHKQGSLYDGTFEDGIITCPKHGAKFSIEKGNVKEKPKVLFLKLPTKKAQTYVTKIKDGDVMILV